LVLDGQQRLTTVVLLPAALCDRLRAIGQEDEAEEYSNYCNVGKLIPTMFDRPDFAKCMSEQRPVGDSSIIQAKCFFSELAETLADDAVEEMIDAVLNRLSYTAFVVQNAAGMQAIFEKMAEKQRLIDQAQEMGGDLYSCVDCFADGEGGKETKSTHFGPEGERLCSECAKSKPTSTLMTPGIPMSPVDVVRNFVFDHYTDDEQMKNGYAKYWGPMEINIGENTANIESGLSSFLKTQGFSVDKRWDLIKSFEGWWGKLNDRGTPEQYANARLDFLLANVGQSTEAVSGTKVDDPAGVGCCFRGGYSSR